MGYSTRFDGTLEFTAPLTSVSNAYLKSFLGEEIQGPEFIGGHAYVDLEFTSDEKGLKWNGAEKTYQLEASVNFVINEMRKEFPDFGLIGSLLAQGEDVTDRWRLVIGADGFASKQEIIVAGKRMTCPHCEEVFFVEDAAPGAKP